MREVGDAKQRSFRQAWLLALMVATVCAACGGLLAPRDGEDGGASSSTGSIPLGDGGAPGSKPPGRDSSSDSTAEPRDGSTSDTGTSGGDAADEGVAEDATGYADVSAPSTWITCDSSACAPELLATDVPRPWGIAVDSEAVYVGNCGNASGPGSIMKISLDGGAATALVESPDPADPGMNCYATAVAIDATDLYWMSYGGNAFVAKVPLVGGQPTVLARGNVQDYAFGMAIDPTNLYWTTATEVIRQPLDGGPPLMLATTSVGANAIAVDATNAYWASGTAIMKTPLAGGPSVQLAPAIAGASGIAVDTENVYWGESSTNALMSVPFVGGSPTVWVGTDGIVDVAVDGTRIYWTTSTGVWELPKSGGPLVQLASSPWSEAIALDSAYVYFTALLGSADGTDSVLRVPK